MIQSVIDWMISLVEQGGLLVPIIGIISIIGVAIIIKKLFELHRNRVFPESERKEIFHAMSRGNDEKWVSAINNPETPMHDIIRSVILTKHMSGDKRENLLLTRSNTWMRDVSNGVPFLGILATISPLLGILGTVIGMIYTMNEVGQVSGADPALVGEGIGQALITTAMGLIVGIPLMIFHRRFKNKVNELSADLHASVYETIDRIERIEYLREENNLPSLPSKVERPDEFSVEMESDNID